MGNFILRCLWTPQQFSDTDKQQQADADTVVRWARDHSVHFIGGTEAGSTSVAEAVRAACARYGYALFLHSFGEWVATNAKLVELEGAGFAGPYIPGTRGLSAKEGGHAPRGIAWATATLPNRGGVVSVGSAHYLTARSMAATGHTNAPLVEGIGAWGRDKGAGSAVAIIQADVNMDDEKREPFAGQPFTTCWDELGKWPPTHEGPTGSTIDVAASYNRDQRVSARGARALDDSELALSTDHYPVLSHWNLDQLAA